MRSWDDLDAQSFRDGLPDKEWGYRRSEAETDDESLLPGRRRWLMVADMGETPMLTSRNWRGITAATRCSP
jgi:hypothetical protein